MNDDDLEQSYLFFAFNSEVNSIFDRRKSAGPWRARCFRLSLSLSFSSIRIHFEYGVRFHSVPMRHVAHVLHVENILCKFMVILFDAFIEFIFWVNFSWT